MRKFNVLWLFFCSLHGDFLEYGVQSISVGLAKFVKTATYF